MSVLLLYHHSALPLGSRIELQLIFVETLLTGRVCFRGDYVSPALICELAPNCADRCWNFALRRTAIQRGEKGERHSGSIDCAVACLDHEYQSRPPTLRASDAGEMEGHWGKNAALRKGECFAPSHFPHEPSA
jgi:hypothetical protein